MTTSESAVSLAVRRVRSLMERHGLPRYRHSAWLANAVGISYSQAHRRMSGTSPWTLEELAQVAGLFGESLQDVIRDDDEGHATTAVLQLGSSALPCHLWLGDQLKQRPHPSDLVAVQGADGWKALHAREAGNDVVYRVVRVDIRPSPASRKSIAVLDDDHDLTDSICAHLDGIGYAARPFYNSSELIASLGEHSYDGFIIDWVVGHARALDLVIAARARHSVAPIIVLTGQMVTGVVDEREIATAVDQYGLVFQEKPVRLSILSATLARTFPAA